MKGVKKIELTDDMCYNFDVKIAFIESLVTTEEYEEDTTLVRLYKTKLILHVGRIEKFLEKDFCFFTVSEVRFVFERSNWVNYDSFMASKILLGRYISYCKSCGIIPSDMIHPVENLMWEDISHVIASEQYGFQDFDELYDYLEEIYSVHNTNAVDENRYLCDKVIFYLFYLGFQHNEIELIKVSDVKERDISVYDDKGELQYKANNVDPRIISACRQLSQLESYKLEVDYEGVARYRDQTVHSYQNSLIRFPVMSPGNHVWSYSTLSRIVALANRLSHNLPLHSKFCNKKISTKKIWFNGIYDRVYKTETELGRSLNYLDHDDAIILRRLFRKSPDFQKLKHSYRSYLEWKQHFYD